MKLQATMNKTTFSIETEGDDLNIEEMLNHFKGLLVAMGYHPKSIERHLPEGEYAWFTEEDFKAKMFKSDFERECG